VVVAALGITSGNDRRRLEAAGRTLLRRLGVKACLITRGSDGMALFEPGRPTLHVPIYGTDQVADVTGAGDTVIATFTLALAAGASPAEACLLANYAGGIVVMKRGTATVSGAELDAAVASDHGRI
jgi:bifunctional ADP-heptose synthase (sugar kinase/adenylyltransferase)